MYTDVPPVTRSERSGIIDETLLTISKELFTIPKFGYPIGVIFNILYIYYCYKKATLFSLIYLVFLFWLIVRVIQTKILKR